MIISLSHFNNTKMIIMNIKFSFFQYIPMNLTHWTFNEANTTTIVFNSLSDFNFS